MAQPPDDDERGRRARANAAMSRHAAGDPAAFRELYEITSGRIYYFLCRMMRNQARAQELLQQTFLRMHEARGSFTPGAAVFPWMYAIANRLAIDCLRRGGREVSLDGDEGQNVEEPICANGAADELMIARELSERIERALREMPETQSAAYRLVHQEGLSYRETAEALGKTIGAVTSLVHRAVESLRAAQQERQD